MRFANAFPLLSSFCAAKQLWSSSPASSSSAGIIRSAYPVGNGLLGLLPYGQPGHDILNINRDSLWTGGPFENTSYNGGNVDQRSQYLPGIRDWIWQNGSGNVSALMTAFDNYGSYAVLGNLTVDIDGITNVSSYRRSLDLKTGVHTLTYAANGGQFQINTYCSYADELCVYDVNSTNALPTLSIALRNDMSDASLLNLTCSSGQVQLRGRTIADTGMIYQATVKLTGSNASTSCENDSLTVSRSDAKRATLILAAGTDFDQSKGNAASNYSFRGVDPSAYVESVLDQSSSKSSTGLLETHLADYQPLANAFTLELPDTQNSSKVQTSELVSRYNYNSTTGDPYLESLTFDFARHLFISSSRNGSLPPNLQGRWATDLSNAWSADYHANINLQMNHWHVDQTGLGDLQTPLWQYMLQNWAPRGRETARLLYNATGWVTHNEMNIFGHTAMKSGDAIWADYPISAAWMMLHVWDHFDYSQDLDWLRNTGYPMLKDISSFWLSQLQEDQYFNDGTLVVNPCTSAEHGPTTFGCTHYQQLIHQLFETTLQSANLLSETDSTFTDGLTSSLDQLDTGLHIGSWGQVQEWKIDQDTQNDTHRHLSNLIGWYPSFSISSYLGGYTNATIQQAVATTLDSRGPGIADANAGWEKVWRSACWARLNNTDAAYYELRLTIGSNWASNLLSMYSGHSTPFQIDANFGFAGAVLSMLVVDLPKATGDEGVRTVVLGPAIPPAWAKGSVKGLKLRGGGSVDFRWDENGLVTSADVVQGAESVTIVNKEGLALA